MHACSNAFANPFTRVHGNRSKLGMHTKCSCTFINVGLLYNYYNTVTEKTSDG